MVSLSISMVNLVLFWLSFLSLTSEAVPSYRFHICSNETTFIPNSTYQSNLKDLLLSLSSNSTREIGFYNNTVGQNPETSVYGLFLCRGDLTPDACQDCVSTATNEIVQQYCPVEKVAMIWYDECMLRYSNRSIFSVMEDQPRKYLWNVLDITEPDRFLKLAQTTLSDLVPLAANASSAAKKFATKEVNFTVLQTMYSLVQCTPDLSSFDCNRCLREAIKNVPTCCSGKQGGRVMYPSCTIRYEVSPFYQIKAVAPPVPAPGPTPIPLLLPPPPGKSGISWPIILAIVASISVLALLALSYYFLRRRTKKKYNSLPDKNAASDITTIESLQFDLATIQAATNKFSDDNRLGGGGFGEVYKGILLNRQEIAVKRLSESSGQGVEEFKNEILVVAKLQHRNLVRLLGFCLEGKEKLLIYEFMPNKSLDQFLFESDKKKILDWSRRYKIIEGIARGILYLHEDSQLRIIHRDLKANNILLDEDMNPKISDFGMARIFGVDQIEGKTKKVIGTYGYMSPEYAMHGQFSVKSDVYSFGVLVLEILSGNKINSLYQSETTTKDLLSYAWEHWSNGTALELLDPTLRDSYSRNEVNQCIHIALLCVQENPADRPTMANIILMLDSYSVTLKTPQQPAVFILSKTEPTTPTE
ncbi:cysteine-rich receptor-like protein kinase 10 [Quercus lobata]|uniref:cysteine-rich receptor-like protein kinase 10 n=1 Tax=Quercus lobata TaxID=97700 RepID=UPI00124901C2|nr:cysteine-rich receptor-like protein kinase 10 [Quercus lobata]